MKSEILIRIDSEALTPEGLLGEMKSWLDSLQGVKGYELLRAGFRSEPCSASAGRGWSKIGTPVMELGRGTKVRALRDLDPVGANVPAGDFGVVFEEANAYGDGNGPMVSWFGGGFCNVYEGDVEVW